MSRSDQQADASSRDALERLLASDLFAASDQQRAFLRYVVGETLAGRAEGIKAYSVGVDALGRPASFDPQQDPIVRVEATRLRRNLERYYAREGRNDPWRIRLPRGSYVPILERADVEAAGAAPPSATAPWWHSPGARLGLSALAVALILLTAFGVARHLEAPAPEIQAAPATLGPMPAAQTIEVLPFAAVGGGPLVTELAAGLSADVVTELARFRQLRVVSRDYARPGADHAVARFAVTGEVQSGDGEVVLNARLVDRNDGHVVWAERMSRPLDGHAPGQLQLGLARAVVGALAPPSALLSHLASRAADRQGEPDQLASWACVALVDRFYEDYRPEALARAQECLLATTERDPRYGTAWAYLAYVRLHAYRYSGAKEDVASLDLARAAAERAVQLEPLNAVAQRALAAVRFAEHDLAGFRELAERALAINPTDADAMADIGSKLAYSGNWEEGLALLRRAMELNPSYPPSYGLPEALDLYRRGDSAAARRAVLAMGPINHPLAAILDLLTAADLGEPAALAAAQQRLALIMPLAAVMPTLRRWNFPEDMLAQCRRSLAKAGIEAS